MILTACDMVQLILVRDVDERRLCTSVCMLVRLITLEMSGKQSMCPQMLPKFRLRFLCLMFAGKSLA